MKNSLCAAAAIVLLGISSAAFSGSYPGQYTSGEAGYKIGCTVANANGMEVCGESLSYQSMKRRQERERAEAERRRQEQQRQAEQNRRNSQR